MPGKPTTVSTKPTLVVSQQQILSHIEAAFSAVEEQANEDLNTTAREVATEDDLGWAYTIPEPPPAFRNYDEEPLSKTLVAPSPLSSPEASIKLPPSIAPSLDEPRSSISSVSSDGIAPPLPSLPPPEPLKEEINGEALTSEEYASLETHFSAPKYRRPPLLNFTIGSYKKTEEDIFGDGSGSLQSVPETSELKSLPEYTPFKDSNHLDVNKKLYVMEGSVRGVRGQVKQRCAEMADNGSSPALIGRSASMLSLAPTSRKVLSNNPTASKPKASIQRANSTADPMRKALSVQNLNDDDDDEDLSTFDLEQEQARLQEEYAKLHEQFVVWNQQLRDNQHVLENQKIVPNTSLPTMNGVSEESLSKIEVRTYTDNDETMKSQTLPRQRSKFSTQVPVEEKRTSTLERPQRPKSQVLANVTIGSWQQRKPVENGSLPSLSKTPFHSVENINRVANNVNGIATLDEKQNGYSSNQSQIKQRPVSVHVGGWSKNSSSSAQEEIEASAQSKPKIDVQISNFGIQSRAAPVSLRSSSTKTNFKPPEVKQTSASRQRLPPEARTEEISEDKTLASLPQQNGRITRSSSSAFKKFVFGNDHDSQPNSSSKTVTYLNGPKELVNGETKTIQVNGNKAHVVSNGFRPSFTIKSAPKVVGFKPVDSSSSDKTNGISVKVAIQPQNNAPPPPPPPQPQVPINKSAGKTVVSSANLKAAIPRKGSRPPVVQLDPREELMLEIRNFGGRTSLRKVLCFGNFHQEKINL